MTNKVIISVVVIILLLIGGGAFVLFSKNKPAETPATSDQSASEAQEQQVDKKSLKDLLLAGVPQKCTFSDLTDEINTEGTTYIADGKVRADFNTTVEGTTTTGHTIINEEATYFWIDGSSTGFKMDVDLLAETESETDPQQGLDLNKTIDYSCDVWIPNQTLFDPPSDVEFSSFAVPTPSADSKDTEADNNLCSSCDALDGEQKTQCLTALNCI